MRFCFDNKVVLGETRSKVQNGTSLYHNVLQKPCLTLDIAEHPSTLTGIVHSCF
jgi:hypothetical protein